MPNCFMDVFLFIWSCCVRLNCNLTHPLPEVMETLLLYCWLRKFLPVGLHFSCHAICHFISLLPPDPQIQRKLEGQVVLCKYAMRGDVAEGGGMRNSG